MNPPETPMGNGAESRDGPGVAQRVGQRGESAHQLYSEARGAVEDLSHALDLRGRVQKHPYGMLFAAAGVGYVLGGGLFTPLTGRILRLGMRLAALPLVKEELLTLAEAAVDGFVRGAQEGTPSQGPATPDPSKGPAPT
ncbi:MAG: hypothetical protein ACOZIN_21435 [Myxococcota bacterium]